MTIIYNGNQNLITGIQVPNNQVAPLGSMRGIIQKNKKLKI